MPRDSDMTSQRKNAIKALTADDVAGAISAYVQLFDRLLKGYLDGSLSASDVEMAYRGDLRSRTLLI